MRLLSAIVWAVAACGVALMGKRRPAAYKYVGQHHTNTVRPQPASKSALADRVQSAGIDQPTEPDYSDEPTAQLKSTPTVIEHETGIGILKPVVDFPVEEPTVALTIDGGETCTAGLGAYECELVDDGHDTHSACGGDITWPREAALVVTK